MRPVALAVAPKVSSMPRSFGWHIGALALGLIVPALLFIAVLLTQFANSERKRIEEELSATARTLAVALNREVNSYVTTLQALATSPALESDDRTGFYAQAQRLREQQNQHFSLRDLNGVTLLTTRLPFGQRIENNRPEVMEADRAAARDRAPKVSGIFEGPVTRRSNVQVVVPVMNGDEVRLVVGASLDPQIFTQVFQGIGRPPGSVASIIDGQNVVVARDPDLDGIVGRQASETFRSRATSLRGLYYGASLQGEPSLVAYETEVLTGWRVVVRIPVAQIDAALRTSLLTLAFGGLLLGAVGLFLAGMVRNRLTTAVGEIGALAAAMRSGRELPEPAGKVAEIARVGDALRDASRELRESERRLRRILDNLFVFVGLLDLDGVLVEANEAPLRAAGLTRDDVVGRPFWECWWWSYSPDVQARIRRSCLDAREGRTSRFDIAVRVAGGAFITIDFQIAPLHDERGEIVGLQPSGVDVTARERAQAELAASKARLELGLTVSGLGLAELDYAADTITLDDKAAALFELKGGTPLPRASVHARFHPMDAEWLRDAIARLVGPEGEGFMSVEHRLLLDQEKVRWLQARKQIRYETDATGARRARDGLLAIQDVSQHRMAEAALRDSEARLQQALTAGGVFAFEWDPATDLVRRTANCEPSLGFSTRAEAEQDTGHDYFGRVHPEDRDHFVATVRARTVEAPTYDIRYRLVRQDGGVIWLEESARATFDGEGRMTRLSGLTRDVTERVRTEEELARSQALMSAIGENSLDIIFAKDREGRVLYANPAYARAVGAERDAVIGRFEAGFSLPGEEADALREVDLRIMSTGVSEVVEETVTTSARGRRVYQVSKAPLRDSSGEVVGIVGVARDITDSKRAADDLKAFNERLEHEVEQAVAERERTLAQLHEMRKLDSLGKLTGGVAHDFNNLLAAILSNLDIVRKSVTDIRTARLLDGAIKGAERGAALTRRLLAFARRQDLKAKAVDLPELWREMQDLLERSLGPSVTLATNFAPGLPPVLVDPNQFELALLNLAVNARDAMPSGGSIEVTAEPFIVAGASPERGLKAGRYVRVAVSDTGAGMDAETLQRAVEPFFTTKGVGKGTGLGLSMVQGLAAQSGGAMAIDSLPGAGTTVVIYLPQADGEAGEGHALAGEPDAPAARDGASSLLVMVVDDDPLVATGTVAMLEDLGHRVIEATSGRQALAQVEAHPELDIVITDHAMPEMTGADLVRLLAAMRPELPVILASGYAELPNGVSVDAPRLSKPFRQEQLVEALERCLKRAI